MTSSRQATTITHLLFWLPWFVLVTSLYLTWLAWSHERQSEYQGLRTQFDFALRETISRIEQRMTAYEQMLRGVQGLFATTPLSDRTALHRYVETLQIDANFSGVQFINVVEKVPLADPTRREAMERARDSGLPAITRNLPLRITPGAVENPGFLMYLPVFAKDQPHNTQAQRRAHLIGWVSAGFHMNSFMASLYGKQASGLNFTIYDDVSLSPEAVMYTSGNTSPEKTQPSSPTALTATEYMVFGGHNWTLTQETSQREFEQHHARGASFIIALTGITLSLSTALLTWLMIGGRARALQLAANMTEEIRHMAQHDTLTGLANRALFSDRMQRQLAIAKRNNGRFALVFLDLDKFKPINDNFGHAIGDQVLQAVAQRLKTAIRASDTVGRIGGDEFVILLSELAESGDAIGLAEKVHQAVAQPLILEGHQLNISCSIGIAIYPDHGSDEASLSKRADSAMYGAKQAGRNSVQLA